MVPEYVTQFVTMLQLAWCQNMLHSLLLCYSWLGARICYTVCYNVTVGLVPEYVTQFVTCYSWPGARICYEVSVLAAEEIMLEDIWIRQVRMKSLCI